MGGITTYGTPVTASIKCHKPETFYSMVWYPAAHNSLFYQLDAQILYFSNIFITFLYMFRAPLCSSSRGQIVLVQHLVSALSLGECSVHRLSKDFLNLCTEQSPKESDDTRCCTNTI